MPSCACCEYVLVTSLVSEQNLLLMQVFGRDLSGNEISELDGASLRGLRRLHDLLLARNRVRRLPADVFVHTPDLQVL